MSRFSCVVGMILLGGGERGGVAMILSRVCSLSFFLHFTASGGLLLTGGFFSRGVVGYWKDPPGYWDKIVWPNYVSLVIFH